MFTYRERIKELARKRNAIILAHNYQVPRTDADVIVLCGVDFMAENAVNVVKSLPNKNLAKYAFRKDYGYGAG